MSLKTCFLPKITCIFVIPITDYIHVTHAVYCWCILSAKFKQVKLDTTDRHRWCTNIEVHDSLCAHSAQTDSVRRKLQCSSWSWLDNMADGLWMSFVLIWVYTVCYNVISLQFFVCSCILLKQRQLLDWLDSIEGLWRSFVNESTLGA